MTDGKVLCQMVVSPRDQSLTKELNHYRWSIHLLDAEGFVLKVAELPRIKYLKRLSTDRASSTVALSEPFSLEGNAWGKVVQIRLEREITEVDREYNFISDDLGDFKASPAFQNRNLQQKKEIFMQYFTYHKMPKKYQDIPLALMIQDHGGYNSEGIQQKEMFEKGQLIREFIDRLNDEPEWDIQHRNRACAKLVTDLQTIQGELHPDSLTLLESYLEQGRKHLNSSK